ncbi:MAG: TobH protein, partial [Mycobacterium sp.]|nr:TobH protein [Mycobacterium sp.]
AEALRNSAGRELFTNPAKVLAERISGRRAVLAGDCAATLALARHGAAVFLRLAGEVVAAAGLADAMVALHSGMTSRFSDPVDRLFHDEEFDGPAPSAVRVLALALAAEREVVTARVAGCGDVDVLGAEDVGDTGETGAITVPAGPTEQQLAVLSVRLEMAAVYLNLVGG